MLNFLFWNIRGKTLERQIAALCKEESIDVLILAESKLDSDKLSIYLNAMSVSNFRQIEIEKRPSIFNIYYNDNIQGIGSIYNSDYFSIIDLIPTAGEEYILTTVHFSSKLHAGSDSLRLKSTNAIRKLKERESLNGHDRTIVVGDFNFNPFEKPMTDMDAFNAISDLDTIHRIPVNKRNGEKYSRFYNPMWGLLGDRTPGPSGSLYYSSSRDNTILYWHLIDQVIVRPSIAGRIIDDYPLVKTTAGQYNLLTENGLPDTTNYSDHLPLIFKLNNSEE